MVEPALGIELSAAEVDPRRRTATAARDWRRIPRHGHARRELRALPVTAKPLPRIELPACDVPMGEQPAERRFGRIYGERPGWPHLRARRRSILPVRAFPNQLHWHSCHCP